MPESTPLVSATAFDRRGTDAEGWPAQVAEVLFDEPSPVAGASDQDGDGSPAALHAWLAASVGALLIEAVARDGQDTGFQRAMQDLHLRAAEGASIDADVWRGTLEPALREVFRRAYDVDQAFATASAAASSFALSRGYSESDAAEYGRAYGEMNTEANLSAFADANAMALADLLARSFAAADPVAYARTYPAAYVRAVLSACGGAGTQERGQARARLADGLVQSMAGAAAAV